MLNEFDGFKKSVSIAAADINSGDPHIMTDLTTEFDEFHLAVTASAAIPGVFPPVAF